MTEEFLDQLWSYKDKLIKSLRYSESQVNTFFNHLESIMKAS